MTVCQLLSCTMLNQMYFFRGLTIPVGRDLPFIEAHDHTQTHHTRYDSFGRVIGPPQEAAT